MTDHGSGVISRIKKLALSIASLVVFSASGQIDSVPDARLDSMGYEQLGEFYANESEPPYQFKGVSVGDSVYGLLNELTSPTNTVDAPSLFRDIYESPVPEPDTLDFAMQKYKPKISLGMGRLAFHGDMYAKGKHFQGPMTGRMGYNLGISQRLTRFLQLDFSAMFGKLGANEHLANRHENFVSEIRAGGVNLLYDFGNFITDAHKIRPFVSLGVSGFEFLSKTDLKDKYGNEYHYWSDGSIRNMAEGSAGAQDAQYLTRDYKYESDIRELNRDGYGKYAERAWAVPLGAGALMKVTDRLDLKLNFQYWFSTTDFIDGIAVGGEGIRKGTKQKDNFTYTSFSLQWDLMTNKKPRRKAAPDTLRNDSWLADNVDSDKDGINDFDDNCQGTPDSVKVNAQGCPLDDDNDGIPNYRDDELASAPGAAVNGRGVTQDDAYWAAWYAQYRNDTTGGEPKIEIVSNYYLAKSPKKKKKKDGRTYTVELVRYSGSIPSDELAFLLSIGDITSSTLADGTTVVYTSGNYEKLSTAVKRRDEFRAQGNKEAGISTVNGTDIVQLRDDELEQLLEAELADLANMNISDSTDEQFSKSDVVYRVQLGAFKNRISTNVFNTSAGVLELKTGESVFRYVTKGFRTIEEAAAVRADLVVQGYSDAFVTAYKDGKRVPLSQTKATVAKGFEEDLTEDKMFSSVDKSLIAFRVQLGPLKKKSQEESMDAKTKVLGSVDKQVTATGSIRYITGEFKTLAEAEKYRKSLEEKGFADAFAIATFRGEIVSIQEAQELLK